MDNANHDLTVTLPQQPVYLNADPTRLAQVVGNLLNNACKFNDKGGRIWLTVERDGGQAVIRVRDSGIGIAADQLPRIFDLFMQVDTSLERSVSGLGIGLALVKTLVEMHGGTVEVHSQGVGRGSEFVARLPALVESAQPPLELSNSKPPPMTSRRILVVDDNRDSATSLVLGGVLTLTWMGVWTGLVWGDLVRIFLVHHVTWSVNSICHLWGLRPYQSRNNFVFGVLALGEGWHNTHHAFPSSARHGLRWWQIDVSYEVIRALALLHLAWNVRLPTNQDQLWDRTT